MRVVRDRFLKSPYCIRTNAICPWATITAVFEGVSDVWEKSGLPSNRPEDVAKIVVGVLADPSQRGGSYYIEGGRAWNIEAGLLHTRPQWLGERQTRDLDAGTAVLGSGAAWVQNQAK